MRAPWDSDSRESSELQKNEEKLTTGDLQLPRLESKSSKGKKNKTSPPLFFPSENHFAGAPSTLSPRRVACDTLLPSPVEARGQKSRFFSSLPSSSSVVAVVVDRRRSRRRRHQEEEDNDLSAAASDGVGQARRVPPEPRQGLGKPCGHGAQQVRMREEQAGKGHGGFFSIRLSR